MSINECIKSIYINSLLRLNSICTLCIVFIFQTAARHKRESTSYIETFRHNAANLCDVLKSRMEFVLFFKGRSIAQAQGADVSTFVDLDALYSLLGMWV